MAKPDRKTLRGHLSARARMLNIVAWAMDYADLSYQSESLLVGSFGDKVFRIFLSEGWAGVVDRGGDWAQGRECRDLDEFIEAVGWEAGDGNQ